MEQIGLWFASLIISALWPLNLLTSFLPHPTFDIHSYGYEFSLLKTATIRHKFNFKCPLSYTTSYIPTTFTTVLQHQQFFNSPILAIHLFTPSFHCITMSWLEIHRNHSHHSLLYSSDSLKFSELIIAPGTTPAVPKHYFLRTPYCIHTAEEKHCHTCWFHFKFITSPLKCP